MNGFARIVRRGGAFWHTIDVVQRCTEPIPNVQHSASGIVMIASEGGNT